VYLIPGPFGLVNKKFRCLGVKRNINFGSEEVKMLELQIIS
jgi:hypothetical protein